jgi:hypothetical protein
MAVVKLVSLGLVLAVTLCGCKMMAARERQASIDKLSAAPVCCTFPKEFRVLPLNAGENRVDITTRSQVYEFDGKKSYFIALSLEGLPGPVELRVRSMWVGGGLFQPVVLIMDKNMQNAKQVDTGLTMHGIDWLEGRLALGANRDEDAFLVIHTTPELVASQTTQDYMANIVLPGSTFKETKTATINHAPIGTLSIAVSNNK